MHQIIVAAPVLLQVEFCFTAEGNDKKPRLISFRGLDSELYYRPSGLLKLSARPVRRLVVDAMHHWLRAFAVDGFVLLSAESMVQVCCSVFHCVQFQRPPNVSKRAGLETLFRTGPVHRVVIIT